MTSLIDGADRTVFALLLAGHSLGDFVFQTRWMVEGKRESRRVLLAHGAEILFVQAALLLPFLSPRFPVLIALLGVAASHCVVDALKVAAERRWKRRLLWFGLDQGLHLAVLAGTTAWLAGRGSAPLATGDASLALERIAATTAIYAFNINGGSAIVSAVLSTLRGAGKPPAEEVRAGRTIGILERIVMLTLVWLGQWSALGFVLTAKSVARFKELEDRVFAESYLVGTLTSFLVAGASGLLLRQLLQ